MIYVTNKAPAKMTGVMMRANCIRSSNMISLSYDDHISTILNHQRVKALAHINKMGIPGLTNCTAEWKDHLDGTRIMEFTMQFETQYDLTQYLLTEG